MTTTCTPRDHLTRENRTWVWSSERCPGKTPNLKDKDCRAGYTGEIGRKEDSTRKGSAGGCGDILSTMNRAKCYKYGSNNPPSIDTIIKCCTGTLAMPDCPAEYCSDSSHTGHCATEMSAYCKQGDNVATVLECKRLKTSPNTQLKEIYAEAVNAYCLTDPSMDKMKTEACRDYCIENPESCRPFLKKMCATRLPTPTNPRIDEVPICGCYYDDMVYSSFLEEMNKKLNLPSGVLDTQPACYYPKCANASIRPKVDCKQVDISQCIQETTVYANGSTIGNIAISPSCKIAGITTRQNICEGGCGDGKECKNSTCVDDKCGASCDYTKQDCNASGVCVAKRNLEQERKESEQKAQEEKAEKDEKEKKEKDAKESQKWMRIGLVVCSIVLLCVASLAIWLIMKKKKPNNAQQLQGSMQLQGYTQPQDYTQPQGYEQYQQGNMQPQYQQGNMQSSPHQWQPPQGNGYPPQYP